MKVDISQPVAFAVCDVGLTDKIVVCPIAGFWYVAMHNHAPDLLLRHVGYAYYYQTYWLFQLYSKIHMSIVYNELDLSA